MLNPRELATVLAGLRELQRHYQDNGEVAAGYPEIFDGVPPMGHSSIDALCQALCQRLNGLDPFAPPIEWVMSLHYCGGESDDKKTRLIGRVRILGADFHVNAEQVREVDGVQESVDAETYVEDIQRLTEGAGETVTIDGRDYLLAITPFQR